MEEDEAALAHAEKRIRCMRVQQSAHKRRADASPSRSDTITIPEDDMISLFINATRGDNVYGGR